jgi:hypothetical protein
MITHDRYTELLSKEINRSITAAEAKDIITFQSTQPKTCPKCQATVFSLFTPARVVHDIEKCAGKKVTA